jgi:cbb3-type cytochrome oxidase cytochrome c subunit
LGGTAGPDLSKVGTRLSTDALVESVVEPGAVVAPGFGTVSAMPAITQFLSPPEVRDVVAYLRTLRDESVASGSPRIAQSAPGLPIGRIAGALAALLLGALVWRCVTRRD